MLSLGLVSAGIALVGTATVGVIAHELSHALALRIAGVYCTVDVLPDRSDPGRLRAGVWAPLARVTPTQLPDDLSPWHLRVTAMTPLCLAVPFGLVLLGVVPDPFAVGNRPLELAAIAWLGCAIPSPRDFSLLWYPERALAAYRGTEPVDG